MKITINARKFNVDEKLREHIEKKIAKFEKFFPGDDPAATVKLSRVRDMERVEVTIQQGVFLFRSEEENSTFMNALDCCMYNIERQMRKNKTRLTKKLRDSIRIPEYEVSEPEEEEFEIRTKTFKVKPMTPEEAILQMNQLGHEFFVFKDVETEETCVVYKRRAGDYGLIIPE
ncbi:MAG: ribosome-associated translation inhibitor RaiA [Clostridia bacterium]|nr:ribosome-associated translation inhibitor RaiA [Clostridia bacterium]